MLGAILGDIVGSRYEWRNVKSKNFELFTDISRLTDDSMMTLAIAKAILEEGEELGKATVKWMQTLGIKYANVGYGGSFRSWLVEKDPQPYYSWGNGAAMRVSPCGFAATSLEDAILLSKTVTEVTHNHPEGLKGAESIAVAIFMARNGSSIQEIKDYINNNYYKIDFKLDDIRESYDFDMSCQGSVPQALEAFFESTGFEDAIRNAVSIGGDSDTIAAITGGIAEAYYGIPADLRVKALSRLDTYQLKILLEFEEKYPPIKK